MVPTIRKRRATRHFSGGMVVAEFAAMKWGLLLSTLLLLPGCYTLADEARARAVVDLDCPSERIETYHGAGGVTVARGCDAWTQYKCFTARSGPVCIHESAAQVNATPSP